MTSPASLSSTLPLDHALSARVISTKNFPEPTFLLSLGSNLMATNSDASTEFDWYETSSASVPTSVGAESEQSTPEANKAAPFATAVIGSTLVSTFFVICCRNMRRKTGEWVGPPTRIRESTSLPVRWLRESRSFVMSMAF